MIDGIKLKNYKGIDVLFLKGIEQTNVICGKNSSGKSTILEALSTKDKYSIGFRPNMGIFSKYASGEAYRYTTPNPGTLQQCMENIFKNCIKDSPVLFPDEKKKFITEYSSHYKIDPFLRPYTSINYNGILDNFFEAASDQSYSPALIPPKRMLKSITKIDSDETLRSNGDGIVNRLFFLKNQHIQSDDFKTYHKILTEFNKITTYTFNIITEKENHLKLLFRIDTVWLEADNCGLGLKDVLIIVTFIIASEHTFYLIEEPENHLHADFQKKLINFIRSVKEKQFFISTHSNVFLDINNTDKIYYCWFDKIVQVSDETTHSKIISDLGYSVTENLTSDAIILTEGPKDIPIVRALLKWVGAFDKYNIKLWPLGGDIMGELDLSIFSGRRNVFAIIDNDPGSKSARNTFCKNCKENGIECYSLQRYAIENYFTIDALKKVFVNQIDDSLTLNHSDPIDKQIGFKNKDKSIKGKNFETIEHMSLADFENTDLLQFITSIKNNLDTYFATEEKSEEK